MRKILRFFLIIILIILFLICSIYCYGLFKYYMLTKNNSIVDMVENLKTNNNYIYQSDIPNNFLNTIIYDLDPNYEKTGAVNFSGLCKDIYHSIKQKQLVNDNDTIVVKTISNLFYQDKSPIESKLTTAFGATTLLSLYDKVSILEIYYNSLCYGENVYGLSNASKHFLNKDIDDLSLEEMLFLYTLSKNKNININDNYDYLISEELKLLNNLLVNKNISNYEYEQMKQNLISSNILNSSNDDNDFENSDSDSDLYLD